MRDAWLAGGWWGIRCDVAARLMEGEVFFYVFISFGVARMNQIFE